MSRSNSPILIGIFSAVLAFALAATPVFAEELSEPDALLPGGEPAAVLPDGEQPSAEDQDGEELDSDQDIDEPSDNLDDPAPDAEDGDGADDTPADDIPADDNPAEDVPAEDEGDGAEEPDGAAPDDDPLLTPAAGQTLNGVDISHWNPGVDFNSLPGDFVIIKATEYHPETRSFTYYTTPHPAEYGLSASTTDYRAQADAALAAGKLIGFYHFATNPSRGASIDQQALAFVNAVKDYLGKAILVLDWENGEGKNGVYSRLIFTTTDSQGNTKIVNVNDDWAYAWLKKVYELTGVKPLIYMSKSVAQAKTDNVHYDWQDVKNDGYQLWGAQYLYRYDRTTSEGKNTKYYVADPVYNVGGNWGPWGAKPRIYQYSSTGHLSGQGSNNNIDVNIMYGSKADWVKLTGDRETGKAATLENGSIVRFVPLTGSRLGIANKDNNVKLSSTNYLDAYWRVTKNSDGSYSFLNLGNGKYLSFSDVKNYGVLGFSNAISANSKWGLSSWLSGAMGLRPFGNNAYRIDIASGGIETTNATIRLYSGNGTPAQRFHVVKSEALTKAFGLGKNITEGIYALFSGVGSSKVLDIAGASNANSANAQIYDSNNTLAQRYKIVYCKYGLYSITVLGSDKALDVAGGRTANGTNVHQYTLNDSLAQLWYFVKNGDSWVIRSAVSDLALDVASGKSDNKTNVRTYKANGTGAQNWTLKADAALGEALYLGRTLEDGLYTFESLVKAGMVLDIKSASTADRGNVQLYSSNASWAQKFDVRYVGNGFYTIRAENSLKVLDVASGKASNGTNVQQYSSNDSRAQLWYFVRNSNGSYVIKSAIMSDAPFVLDVKAASTSNGTNVQIYRSNGTSAQSWNIGRTSLLADGVYTFGSNATQGAAFMLEVAAASKASGANVQLYQLNGTAAQKWEIAYDETFGAYTVKNVNSGLYLDVKNGSPANGTNVLQSVATGKPSQYWVLTFTEQGGVAFMNLGTGNYLDIPAGKASNKANVQSYTGNGTAAQSFEYRPDPGTLPTGKLGTFVNRMIYYCEVISMGYDQWNRQDFRDGGECDCSSLVIRCLNEAGFATGSASYTGNMRRYLTANGWVVLSPDLTTARPGDILLNDSWHTCAVISGYGMNAKIAQASIDENGNIYGGKGGDQTGKETNIKNIYTYSQGWNCILRYPS